MKTIVSESPVATPAGALGGTPPACGDHSELPWRLVELRDGKWKIVDGVGRTVLHCPKVWTNRDRANLALIVQAVNVGQPEASAHGIRVEDVDRAPRTARKGPALGLRIDRGGHA